MRTPVEPSSAEPRVVTPEADDVTAEAAGCADSLQLHGKRRATGLTPLIWGSVVVLVVLAVLVWQLG